MLGRPGKAKTTLSCALLNKAASPTIAHIDDRTPVVLKPIRLDAWLVSKDPKARQPGDSLYRSYRLCGLPCGTIQKTFIVIMFFLFHQFITYKYRFERTKILFFFGATDHECLHFSLLTPKSSTYKI
jgi:hypothetical protein